MGKLPFRVGRGKKLPRRVGECDNSLEGLTFLLDQFTLELNSKITIFKEKDNWKKWRRSVFQYPPSESFPFASFPSRLPFRIIGVFSWWYHIVWHIESCTVVYSSIVPMVSLLKTSILHHCWHVSILNIVSSTTSSTASFFHRMWNTWIFFI